MRSKLSTLTRRPTGSSSCQRLFTPIPSRRAARRPCVCVFSGLGVSTVSDDDACVLEKGRQQRKATVRRGLFTGAMPSIDRTPEPISSPPRPPTHAPLPRCVNRDGMGMESIAGRSPERRRERLVAHKTCSGAVGKRAIHSYARVSAQRESNEKEKKTQHYLVLVLFSLFGFL